MWAAEDSSRWRRHCESVDVPMPDVISVCRVNQLDSSCFVGQFAPEEFEDARRLGKALGQELELMAEFVEFEEEREGQTLSAAVGMMAIAEEDEFVMLKRDLEEELEDFPIDEDEVLEELEDLPID